MHISLAFAALFAVLLVCFGTAYADDDDHHHAADEHHTSVDEHEHSGEHAHHDVDAGEEDAEEEDWDDSTPSEEPTTVDDDEYHEYGDHTDDDDDSDEAWHRYEKKYNEKFDSPEDEEKHKELWKESKTFVKHEFPKMAADEGWHFKVAVNELSDKTPAELVHEFMGKKPVNYEEMMANGIPLPKAGRHKRDIPDAMDWRKKGGVTPAKLQDHLGTCWAFAAAAALETQYWKHSPKKKLVSLSVEPMITCCENCYSEGALKSPKATRKWLDTDDYPGGEAYNGFNFGYQYGRFPSFKTMPYRGNKTNARLSTACTKKIKLKKEKKMYYTIDKGDEEALMRGLATTGPAAIALNADSRTFKGYDGGGVYKDKTHCRKPANHAMTVVGYDTVKNGPEKGTDYFIIKNSWGEWGEKGFMRYKRGLCGPDENGIASEVQFPIYPYK